MKILKFSGITENLTFSGIGSTPTNAELRLVAPIPDGYTLLCISEFSASPQGFGKFFTGLTNVFQTPSPNQVTIGFTFSGVVDGDPATLGPVTLLLYKEDD